MKKKIREIATVRLGHHFREKVSAVQEGAVSVIQMKDINSDLTIVWDGLVRVQAEKMNDVNVEK